MRLSSMHRHPLRHRSRRDVRVRPPHHEASALPLIVRTGTVKTPRSGSCRLSEPYRAATTNLYPNAREAELAADGQALDRETPRAVRTEHAIVGDSGYRSPRQSMRPNLPLAFR